MVAANSKGDYSWPASPRGELSVSVLLFRCAGILGHGNRYIQVPSCWIMYNMWRNRHNVMSLPFIVGRGYVKTTKVVPT